MCGIAGLLDTTRSSSREHLTDIATHMRDTLRHRGPDDAGTWTDPECGVSFAHRRLPIVDLSLAGHQPMISADGRFVLIFNGEIYNFERLRAQLVAEEPSISFRGHSDTEVMLAAFTLWAFENALTRFNGMFAFALWDRKDRVLRLARDRFGEKPLYYGMLGKTFVFASELKALRAHPDSSAEINRGALALYMRHNCIPAPHSIYKGIYKLPPACTLTFPLDCRELPDPQQYWSLKELACRATERPFNGDDAAALEELDRIVSAAVTNRMVADVPLGAFLSGGIDSSTIVAAMQRSGSRPARTFSIGFHEQDYNEAPAARAVGEHLGTDHTELYVTAEEAMETIPELAGLYDEPFADASQIPTLLVSRMARRQVTVALSGDGGDEIFAGYNRHTWALRIWKKVGWMPRPVRRALGAAIRTLPPRRWEALLRALAPALSSGLRQQMPGYKMHKLAKILDSADLRDLYLRLASHWHQPDKVVLGAAEAPSLLSASESWNGLSDFRQQMLYLDAVTYLPDDILVKVDRASMSTSLEVRVPYLDPELAEFAWRLPMHMKIRGGQGKWILRQLLYKYVPRELVERPKTGFGLPLDGWLRGTLRAWAEDLISADRLRREGFFDTAAVRDKWEDHLAGRDNWQYHLWDVLMFQSWLDSVSSETRTRCAVQ